MNEQFCQKNMGGVWEGDILLLELLQEFLVLSLACGAAPAEAEQTAVSAY